MENKDLNVCKKKIIKFSFKGWTLPTPLKMKKIMGALSTFLASISVASYFNDREGLAFLLLVIQVAIRELILPFFSSEEQTIITTKECDEIGCEDITHKHE